MKRLSQIIIEIIEMEGGLYALEVYRKLLIKKEGGLPCHKGSVNEAWHVRSTS